MRPSPSPGGPAAEETVRALTADGRLDDADAGLVRSYLSVSAMLDVSPIPPAAVLRDFYRHDTARWRV